MLTVRNLRYRSRCLLAYFSGKYRLSAPSKRFLLRFLAPPGMFSAEAPIHSMPRHINVNAASSEPEFKSVSAGLMQFSEMYSR